MKSNNAFERAALDRVENYLAEIEAEIPQEQVAALIGRYAGHNPWALPEFEKAAEYVEEHLGALGGKRIPYAKALEVVARMEGAISWDAWRQAASVLDDEPDDEDKDPFCEA